MPSPTRCEAPKREATAAELASVGCPNRAVSRSDTWKPRPAERITSPAEVPFGGRDISERRFGCVHPEADLGVRRHSRGGTGPLMRRINVRPEL